MEPNHTFRPNLEEINTKIVDIVSTLNVKMSEVEASNNLRAVCMALDPPHPELVEEGRRVILQQSCKFWMMERMHDNGKVKLKNKGKGKGETYLILCNDICILVQVGIDYSTIPLLSSSRV